MITSNCVSIGSFELKKIRHVVVDNPYDDAFDDAVTASIDQETRLFDPPTVNPVMQALLEGEVGYFTDFVHLVYRTRIQGFCV